MSKMRLGTCELQEPASCTVAVNDGCVDATRVSTHILCAMCEMILVSKVASKVVCRTGLCISRDSFSGPSFPACSLGLLPPRSQHAAYYEELFSVANPKLFSYLLDAAQEPIHQEFGRWQPAGGSVRHRLPPEEC